VLGVLIDDGKAGPTVRQAMPGSGAATAGIKAGDVITHINGQPVRSMVELQGTVRKYRVGDVVKVTVRRADEKLEFSVRLGMPEDSFDSVPGPAPGGGPGREPRDGQRDPTDRSGQAAPTPATPSWRGPVNHRRDDFPAAIQHDTVLRPNDCAGPVVDLAGNVIGINIARADRTGSYALPVASVRAAVEKIRSDAEARDNSAKK
jgi:serine protease Do